MGNTTPVATLPSVDNSLFPTKIWSTILYSALTNRESTHGTQNFSISLKIFSFPKNSPFWSFTINKSPINLFIRLFGKERLKPIKERKNGVEFVEILRRLLLSNFCYFIIFHHFCQTKPQIRNLIFYFILQNLYLTKTFPKSCTTHNSF